MPIPARLRFFMLIPLGVCLALITGCSSEPQSERTDGPPESVPDYPVAMTGQETFSDGVIVATVTLGMPTRFKSGSDEGGRGGKSHSGHRGGGRRGGGGGMSGGMGGGGYGGGMQSGDEGPGPESASGDEAPPPRVAGSHLPPAQLKLHLKNTSASETVSCEVVDFNSSLGNFAVFPSNYKIEAGQTLTSEIMTSRMGVEGSEIPVKVALRIGDHVERKVIKLSLISPPEKPPGKDPAK